MLVGTSNEKHLFLKGPKGKSQVHWCHFHFLAKVRKHNKINTHGMKTQYLLTKGFSHRQASQTKNSGCGMDNSSLPLLSGLP